MLNGDGLRVVLWMSGCSHYCKECQNPLTWDPNGGLPFDEKAKEELFAELRKSYISGITLSGGDPLYQGNKSETEALAAEIKKRFPNKTIWLYTGDLWEEIKTYPLLSYIDVLVDGEYDCSRSKKTLHWKGSSNQRVIDVQESLRCDKVVLHCK